MNTQHPTRRIDTQLWREAARDATHAWRRRQRRIETVLLCVLGGVIVWNLVVIFWR